jgi:hypothetical protein
MPQSLFCFLLDLPFSGYHAVVKKRPVDPAQPERAMFHPGGNQNQDPVHLIKILLRGMIHSSKNATEMGSIKTRELTEKKQE